MKDDTGRFSSNRFEPQDKARKRQEISDLKREMTTFDDICEAADKFGREDSRERSFRQRQSVGVDIAFKEANAANQQRCCYGEHCLSGGWARR